MKVYKRDMKVYQAYKRDMEAYQAYKRKDRVVRILLLSSMKNDIMLRFERTIRREARLNFFFSIL